MSKERLEEAKLMAEMLRAETRLPHDFPFDLVDWLVEQAERVQELENHIDHLYDNNVHLKGDYRIQEQNKRYREAIKECLERMNKGGAGTRTFVYETLKEALEGEREMNEFCPTCYGSGGIDVLDYSIGEIVTIPCPDCGGSGELEGEK